MDRRNFLRNLLSAAAAPYVPAKSFFFAPAMGWKPFVSPPAFHFPVMFEMGGFGSSIDFEGGGYPRGTGAAWLHRTYILKSDGVYEIDENSQVTKLSREILAQDLGQTKLAEFQEHLRRHGAVLPGERTARPSTSRPQSRRT